MNIKGTCVFVQCDGVFCSTRPSEKCNSKWNSNKFCFISTSESAFDFRIYLTKQLAKTVKVNAKVVEIMVWASYMQIIAPFWSFFKKNKEEKTEVIISNFISWWSLFYMTRFPWKKSWSVAGWTCHPEPVSGWICKFATTHQ